MDASAASASATDYLSETLSRSFSSSRLDCEAPPLQRLITSSLSASPSDPCLYRTASASSSSLSKLNARAPEFKPRASVSPPSSPMLSPSISSSSLSSLSSSTSNLLALAQQSQQTDLAASFVIPRPPGPPALVHVFNSGPTTSGASSGSIFHINSSSFDANTHNHFGLGYRGSQLQFYAGLGGFLDHQQDLSVLANSDASDPSKCGLSEEIALKIINQVEFYFSDVNLATTGFLYKVMVKDPEGYVPISVIASIKKIKTLTKNQSQLSTVLRNSSKLVVSEDGKKVKRVHPLSELDMEDVQSRIIIAENLPEDHCHQNLLRIFSAVGSVKSIRSCQPNGPSSTSRTAKTDGVNFSNKLHAFVEYESVELAEKAVLELNEGNWRNGLKVRLLLKHSPKFAQARVKKFGQESEHNFKEEDGFGPEQVQLHEKYLEDFMQQPSEPVGEEHANSKDGGLKKSRSREFREVSESRGWGKGRGRPTHNSNNRGNHVGLTPNGSLNIEHPTVAKQPSVPRMPDGTRGFSMGRGKPFAVKIA